MANQYTKGEDKEATEQQLEFVDAFLRTGNGTYAASHAGYAHPERAAAKLLSKPHIRKLIQRAMAAKALEFAPEMIRTLAELALDAENVQAKDRIAAANAVLDRALGPAKQPIVNINNNTGGGASAAETATEVMRLIRETFNKGRGGQTAIPAGGEMQLIELKPHSVKTAD